MAHLFVVDADADHRDFLTRHFRHAGHDVVGLGDPLAALDLAPVLPIDLMLLDWGLSEPDGHAVCRALRAVPWLRELPVLALVPCWSLVSASEAASAGAAGVVAKPFALTELARQVDDLLSATRLPA